MSPAPSGGLAGRRSIAAQIRADIRDRLSLTCSVGVASTKFVAKVASARCKPDGLLVVPAASALDFLHPVASHRAVGRRGAYRRAAPPTRGAHDR